MWVSPLYCWWAGKWPCPRSCLLTWFKHACRVPPQRAGDKPLTAYPYFKQDDRTFAARDNWRKGFQCLMRADWIWLFPIEPDAWQLAGLHLWVTRQTSAGEEGTEGEQLSDWNAIECWIHGSQLHMGKNITTLFIQCVFYMKYEFVIGNIIPSFPSFAMLIKPNGSYSETL